MPNPVRANPRRSGPGSLVAVVAMLAVSITVIAISIVAQSRRRTAAPDRRRAHRVDTAVSATGVPWRLLLIAAVVVARVAAGGRPADAVGIRPGRRRRAGGRPRTRRAPGDRAVPNPRRPTTPGGGSRRVPVSGGGHDRDVRPRRRGDDDRPQTRRRRGGSARRRRHVDARAIRRSPISRGPPNSGWPRSATAAANRARRSSPATRRWSGNWRSRRAPPRRTPTPPRRCWPAPSSTTRCAPTARPNWSTCSTRRGSART